MQRNIDIIEGIAGRISAIGSKIYKFDGNTDGVYMFSIYGFPAELINAFAVEDRWKDGHMNFIADFGVESRYKPEIVQAVTGAVKPDSIVENENYFMYPIAVTGVNGQYDECIIFIRIFDRSVYLSEEAQANNIVLIDNPIAMAAITKKHSKHSDVSALNLLLEGIKSAAKKGKSQYEYRAGTSSQLYKYGTCNILWALNKLEEAGYKIEYYGMADNHQTYPEDTRILIKW